MRLLTLLLSLATLSTAQTPGAPIPSVDEIVTRLVEHDGRRDADFRGYTAVRHYVLENERHHKRAEMSVKVACRDNGEKEFATSAETGWGIARHHVFPRLLESESEASRPGAREQSRITPDNYSFAMAGRDSIDGRPAWVIDIAPKTDNKYLIRGRIWVDAEDYAIARIEGRPAKNPSFWIKSVHFVHTYQKNGSQWLPAADRSETDARIIGKTELTIEYFGYETGAATLAASGEPVRGDRP